MYSPDKRIVVVTGHYGCGKTNFSLNLAQNFPAGSGRDRVLVDLDIVNPYFRSADYQERLASSGVAVECPPFAGTNLDTPILSGRIDALLRNPQKQVILDVGGDDAGAAALGRFSGIIREQGYEMLYLVNYYRYLTRRPEDALEILQQVEAASRLKATGLVNCSNLARSTTREDVLGSMDFAREVARLTGLPLLFTAVDRQLGFPQSDEFYGMDIYVKSPWEEAL